MTLIDYGIIGGILISARLGFSRGLSKEISALCLWIIAIWSGWRFSRQAAIFLPASIENPSIRAIIAYSLLVGIILTLGHGGSYFLNARLKKSGLTRLNQVAGMLLGIARGMVVVCIFVILAGLSPMSEQVAWQQSSLQPLFQSLALWLREQIQP